LGHPNISGTAKDTNFKFCKKIDLEAFSTKNEKFVISEHGLGYRTNFSNYGTNVISLERLKIQTSNFACRLSVRDTKPKMKIWLKLGVA